MKTGDHERLPVFDSVDGWHQALAERVGWMRGLARPLCLESKAFVFMVTWKPNILRWPESL